MRGRDPALHAAEPTRRMGRRNEHGDVWVSSAGTVVLCVYACVCVPLGGAVGARAVSCRYSSVQSLSGFLLRSVCPRSKELGRVLKCEVDRTVFLSLPKRPKRSHETSFPFSVGSRALRSIVLAEVNSTDYVTPFLISLTRSSYTVTPVENFL